MKEKKKKNYEAPQIEKFGCRVEKGFTNSGLGLDETEGNRNIETRQGVGGWGTNGAIWT